jgi:hypothetical protein
MTQRELGNFLVDGLLDASTPDTFPQINSQFGFEPLQFSNL